MQIRLGGIPALGVAGAATIFRTLFARGIDSVHSAGLREQRLHHTGFRSRSVSQWAYWLNVTNNGPLSPLQVFS